MNHTKKIVALTLLTLAAHQAQAAQWQQKIKDVSTKEWVTYTGCLGCLVKGVCSYQDAINSSNEIQAALNKSRDLLNKGITAPIEGIHNHIDSLRTKREVQYKKFHLYYGASIALGGITLLLMHLRQSK